MGFKLTREETDALRTDKVIVDRLVVALQQLKQCRSKAEREDYGVVLAAVAPHRYEARSQDGMIRRVSQRLRVQRGSRYVKATGERRPRAFDQAVTRRDCWDAIVERNYSQPINVGDECISRGRPCMVLAIDHEQDTCLLRFTNGSISCDRRFAHIAKGDKASSGGHFPKGSARLLRAPPSLRPGPRNTRNDEKAEAARPKVEELFINEGARSPSQRDQVRRRLGVGVYEYAQALYVYSKYATLYALYLARYPAHVISFAVFKGLRPWYIRRARQETCLCKQCENFKEYRTVLCSLASHFEHLLNPSDLDAEDAIDDDQDEAEIDAWSGKPHLLRLLELCKTKSKSDLVKACLCEGALDGAGKIDCVNGSCANCGFYKFWSEGLRPHVIGSDGSIRSDAPVEFQSVVRWTKASTSSNGNQQEATTAHTPKKPKYESQQGTIVQFLDDFERTTFRKFPLHRLTVLRQKAMAAQFARNRCPGWLHFDVDFAMDGEIPPPYGRAIQSDHWSPMTYTLFPLVASWLELEAWVRRDTQLQLGDAVTVEPHHLSIDGALQPAEGSFWAEVVGIPSVADLTSAGNQLYTVRKHGAASDVNMCVERRFLRHRKLHTKAYIHISDDKTHDSSAAQMFIKKTLQHLQEHYVDTGMEVFHSIHIHSDNASSHFKSSQTMNFVTSLPAQLSAWVGSTGISFRVLWEFGPPGHGKGVWDGIGAWMKRTVRQDIVDDRPDQPTLKTATGKILTPADVAHHLHARFCTEDFKQSHSLATINELVVLYTPTGDITRPVGQKFTAMHGMKSTYIFMAIREGVVLQRRFACWCQACMKASAPGEGTMDSNYVCSECASPELTWRETVVEREDAPGIQERRSMTVLYAFRCHIKTPAHSSACVCQEAYFGKISRAT